MEAMEGRLKESQEAKEKHIRVSLFVHCACLIDSNIESALGVTGFM